jgi:hypothetical protein
MQRLRPGDDGGATDHAEEMVQMILDCRKLVDDNTVPELSGVILCAEKASRYLIAGLHKVRWAALQKLTRRKT